MNSRTGVFFAFLMAIIASGAFSAQAQDNEPVTWSDLGTECFRERIEFLPEHEETVKLQLLAKPDLILEQQGDLIPFRFFQHGTEADFPYSIVDISGLDPQSANDTALIKDGNPNTGIAFDPYSDAPKQLEVDLGQVIAGGSLLIRLEYDGQLYPAYFISRDGSSYIRVDEPERFSFRFLRIEFVPYSEQDLGAKNLTLRHLEIVTAGKDVLLTLPASDEPLRAYAGFTCPQTEVLRKALIQTETGASAAAYSTDVDTPVLDGTWSPNPEYETDFDGDGIANEVDNCPYTANEAQTDTDGDLKGDVCDLDSSVKNFLERDSDRDGLGNRADNCPYVFNPQQEDQNADGLGDLCADDDQDGIIGHRDNCIDTPNPDQADVNINGVGDACEFDFDQDGVFDSVDNCRSISNPAQSDQDNDGIGDACDNCELYNPRQVDADGNGRGDVCERDEEYRETHDEDGDGILDAADVCPEVPDPEQIDTDQDGTGDRCDNCPQLKNSEQEDINENGIGDMCEDFDSDGIEGYLDNCPYHHNPGQEDTDNDGIGDPCEDDDRDGIVAAEDNCPFSANRDQRDTDGDGFGDACDSSDDRLLESNKWIVAGVIVLVTALFGWLIFIMIRKMK